MQSPITLKTALRRTLTSLAAIMSISIIFGAKALENAHEADTLVIDRTLADNSGQRG